MIMIRHNTKNLKNRITELEREVATVKSVSETNMILASTFTRLLKENNVEIKFESPEPEETKLKNGDGEIKSIGTAPPAIMNLDFSKHDLEVKKQYLNRMREQLDFQEKRNGYSF